MPGAQDRWGQLAEPSVPGHEAASADRPYAARQPERGSIADLRRRMERLPPGHPSSPYNDDMTPKPPVARLKDLELPLHTTEQGGDGAGASGNGASARNRIASTLVTASALSTAEQLAQPFEEAKEPQEAAGEPDGDGPGGSAGGPHGAPGWVSAPTWADTGLGDQAGPAAPASEDGTASWDAASWAGASAWDSAPDLDAANGNEAVPRWGEPEPGPDTLGYATIDAGQGSAADEPLTGLDGSWDWNGRYLTPDESRMADAALGRCRIAEGRNVFGGYGHSGLTPAMRRIEAQLEHGQLRPDTENCTLKPADSFKKRFADLILRHPDKPAEELALEVHDGIRYTFLFAAEHYTDGTLQAHSRLKGSGFELEVRRNCWQNPEYKGINSRWRDPAHDLVFEVRFHTPASWELSERARSLHEATTDPATPPEERERLRSIYGEMSAAVPVPPGCTTIPDYRREG